MALAGWGSRGIWILNCLPGLRIHTTCFPEMVKVSFGVITGVGNDIGTPDGVTIVIIPSC